MPCWHFPQLHVLGTASSFQRPEALVCFAHSSYMFIVSFLALLRKWDVTSTRFVMFLRFTSRVCCYLDHLCNTHVDLRFVLSLRVLFLDTPLCNMPIVLHPSSVDEKKTKCIKHIDLAQSYHGELLIKKRRSLQVSPGHHQPVYGPISRAHLG